MDCIQLHKYISAVPLQGTYCTVHVYMCAAHVGVNRAPFHVQVCLQTTVGELLLLCGVTLPQSLEACEVFFRNTLQVDCQLTASCECQLC